MQLPKARFCTTCRLSNANKYHQHASSPLHRRCLLVNIIWSSHNIPKIYTTIEHPKQWHNGTMARWCASHLLLVCFLCASCAPLVRQKHASLRATCVQHACTSQHSRTLLALSSSKIKKNLNHSTRDSHVVPHHGTSQAALWLTSQIGRDAVLSKSYGRG